MVGERSWGDNPSGDGQLTGSIRTQGLGKTPVLEVPTREVKDVSARGGERRSGLCLRSDHTGRPGGSQGTPYHSVSFTPAHINLLSS